MKFIFAFVCGASKGLKKALKALKALKPFEAPQRSMKIEL